MKRPVRTSPPSRALGMACCCPAASGERRWRWIGFSSSQPWSRNDDERRLESVEASAASSGLESLLDITSSLAIIKMIDIIVLIIVEDGCRMIFTRFQLSFQLMYLKFLLQLAHVYLSCMTAPFHSIQPIRSIKILDLCLSRSVRSVKVCRNKCRVKDQRLSLFLIKNETSLFI